MTLSAARKLTPTSYFADVKQTALQVIYAAGAPDVTAPTVSSWTIAADGLSSSVVHSEAVILGTDGIAGLVLAPTNGGAAVALTYSSGDGTDTLVLSHSRAITSNETLTRAYTQPGDGIQDLAATRNLLASFAATAVTNNSTVNNSPTNITLSNSSVLTTGGLNAVVGVLSTTDDPGDTFTYSLVVGTGDTNNASFSISGANLRCNNPATLGAGTYSVRIQSTDGVSTPRAEAFTITVALPDAGGNSVGQGKTRSSRHYPMRY